MATYYRWNRNEKNTGLAYSNKGTPFSETARYCFYTTSTPTIKSNGFIDTSGWTRIDVSTTPGRFGAGTYFWITSRTSSADISACYYVYYGYANLTYINSSSIRVSGDSFLKVQTVSVSSTPGEFISYVYSTSSTAYPNGGVSGSYYYNQRTTITSPTAPTGLTYPNPITTPTVTVNWNAATSNTDYPLNYVFVEASINGGGFTTVLTSGNVGTQTLPTSFTYSVPSNAVTLQFRVRYRDSNQQYSSYDTGPLVSTLLAPTLTVPQMVMQGQQATISWSEVEGADSYTLERKSSADADWTQVYNGANLSYTETVGTWTSLQYRVQAVFDETPGGWATSGDIQIVSASALVISGSDGDLGTLTSDVSYSVSSDQTSPVIDVTVAVNGGEYASFQATSGQNYRIGVLDLPTGTGSIVITATTTVSASPVTVTRTWTYTKAAQSFPNAGSVARLTQEGDTIWPQTLAEAVRTTGGPWGGDLSKALNLLMKAALYNGESGDFSDLWGNDIPTVKIETGSYTGTGTYGAENPNTLVFSGKPLFVFVSSGAEGTALPMINPATSTITEDGSLLNLTWNEKAVQYRASSAPNQLNSSGATYYYVAFLL